MSGGEYDFLYRRVEEFARRMMKGDQPAYRRAFGQKLLDMSVAMHDIEWVDSADYSWGDDKETIMKCVYPQSVLKVCVKDAEELVKELQRLIEEVKGC